jgi:hypothetical protein
MNNHEQFKHTPGPWALEQCGENTIKIFKATDKRRGRIATIKTKDSSWLELDQADAKLIAAAPELLQALEAYIKEVKEQALALGWKSAEQYQDFVGTPGDAYDKALAAIAKAKGE